MRCHRERPARGLAYCEHSSLHAVRRHLLHQTAPERAGTTLSFFYRGFWGSTFAQRNCMVTLSEGLVLSPKDHIFQSGPSHLLFPADSETGSPFPSPSPRPRA